MDGATQESSKHYPVDLLYGSLGTIWDNRSNFRCYEAGTKIKKKELTLQELGTLVEIHHSAAPQNDHHTSTFLDFSSRVKIMFEIKFIVFVFVNIY